MSDEGLKGGIPANLVDAIGSDIGRLWVLRMRPRGDFPPDLCHLITEATVGGLDVLATFQSTPPLGDWGVLAAASLSMAASHSLNCFINA